MIIQNIIDSWKHIPYTLRHYAAFLRTEKKYIGYYKYKFQIGRASCRERV